MCLMPSALTPRTMGAKHGHNELGFMWPHFFYDYMFVMKEARLTQTSPASILHFKKQVR